MTAKTVKIRTWMEFPGSRDGHREDVEIDPSVFETIEDVMEYVDGIAQISFYNVCNYGFDSDAIEALDLPRRSAASPKLAVVDNPTSTGSRADLHDLIETWASNLGQSVSDDLSAFDLAALERLVRAWAGGNEVRLQSVLAEIDFYAPPEDPDE